jgi:hypothetical protein
MREVRERPRGLSTDSRSNGCKQLLMAKRLRQAINCSRVQGPNPHILPSHCSGHWSSLCRETLVKMCGRR